MKLQRLAIFASGAGSNADRILHHFKQHPQVEVALVVCNKPGAGVLEVARRHGVETLLVQRDRFANGDAYLPELQQRELQWLVLAGFLWKVPPALVNAYPRHIINIHPALLPKYGGKGMYGHHVHQAVLDAGDTESGITIHYVDELYDHGATIFQATCAVLPGDTASALAQRIHQLEHQHYPAVLEQLVLAGNTTTTPGF